MESELKDIESQVKSISGRLSSHFRDDYTPGKEGSESPEVITIQNHSAPRVIWSGEDLVEVNMPAGSKVIYAKEPMSGLSDFKNAVRYAVRNPLGMEPLRSLLFPGMKLTIAIDDISLPLPPMVTPDLRQTMLEVILEMTDQTGIDDIHMIVATAFHRRMTDAEIRRMTGTEIYNRFAPDRLYNHDAEKPDGMKWLGHTDAGETVRINRRAAESDLIIYVNINFVPMNGGHKSVATGLAGYHTLREHHDPEVIHASNSYMDAPRSSLADANRRIGQVIESKIKVFHLESAVNNRTFQPPLQFLAKNEDTWNTANRAAYQALKQTLSRMSPAVKRKVFQKVYAPYEAVSVHGGHVDPVHERILKISKQQYSVNVEGQCDILVLGIPFVSPYSVNSILNPLLVQVMALGYLYHLYEGGVPLLREGGVIVLYHPCRDEFDPEFHPSYIEFFHRLLPETTDSKTLQKKYEMEFATNKNYIEMYSKGHAYHGVHPFYMWYWGESGRRRTGAVIAVGAEDKHVPERMGWMNADSLEQAIMMARPVTGDHPKITMLKQPPVAMARLV